MPTPFTSIIMWMHGVIYFSFSFLWYTNNELMRYINLYFIIKFLLTFNRGGVEGPAGTANAVPLFTVVRIAVPLFKASRTGAANVPPRMRDCSARAYSTYARASTVKLILTKAIV